MKWRCAAVFGASGAIGGALVKRLAEQGTKVFAGSRGAPGPVAGNVTPFHFDLTDEASIADAALLLRGMPLDLVIVATGRLTLEDGSAPERSFKHVSSETMADVFALNTIGPALVAKHLLPLLPRAERCVFAALSARVGSIGDNRIGGWHSYRASKAALNMLIRNYAIELARTHKQASVIGLHPGTVNSALSEPFQTNLPSGQLTNALDAADYLLAVLDKVGPQDSGKVFDWKGEEVPA